MKKQNLIGRKFGRLTVVSEAAPHVTNNKKRRTYRKWTCKCSCGNIMKTLDQSLTSGDVKSCGCYKRDMAILPKGRRTPDITGKSFGYLTVVKEVAPNIRSNGDRHTKWLCECKCGNTKEVEEYNLKIGHTQSCGCFQRKMTSKANLKHGFTKPNEKKHPIYELWVNMKNRCIYENMPTYKDYGGRGITVCAEWANSSVDFIKWALSHGWKKKLTIDRIDNDGNYEPSNCRFVTQSVNSVNQRKRKTNTSGYTGVYYHKVNKRFQSGITYLGICKTFGGFDTKKKALEARNNYIIENDLPHKIQEYKGE